MGKVTITIAVGGDVSRLHRVAEEISGLIEDAGYLVSDYSIDEEEVKMKRKAEGSRGVVVEVATPNAKEAWEIIFKLGYKYMSLYSGLLTTRMQIPVAKGYEEEVAEGIKETLKDEGIQCEVIY